MVDQTRSRNGQAQLRRQLAAYFLATFAISWGIFAGALAFGFAESPIVILGVWRPSLSAIIVTAAFYGSDRLMGPDLGVATLYWVLALYVLCGGFSGLGTPPEFEHPVEAR